MQLTRKQESWNPFRELEDLTGRFNRLLNWAGNGGAVERVLSPSDWSPACDITENEKEYSVVAELPNVKKDDVHVTLDDGVLCIRGERKEQKEDKGVKVHRRESFHGTFYRSFVLPDDADGGSVDAQFKDGTLSIKIPKAAKKAPKAKEISIQ